MKGGGGGSMAAEYTDFGLLVKTKLLGPPARTQSWLAGEVRARTGLFAVKTSVNHKTGWVGCQTVLTPKGMETFRLLCQGM